MNKLNVVIAGFIDEPLGEVARAVVKKLNVDRAVFVYRGIKIPLPVETEYIDLRPIYAFADYDVDWNLLRPLDERIINGMRECEAVALRMMDRMETNGVSLSYEARRRIYLRHLRFWNHIMETQNIKLFLSANIPHEVYDYVLYSLCKRKKVPTVFLFQVNKVRDLVVVGSDWQKQLPDYEAQKFAHRQMSAKFHDYLEDQRGSKKPTEPFWIAPGFKSIKRQLTFAEYLKDVQRQLQSRPQDFFQKITTLNYWREKWARRQKVNTKNQEAAAAFAFYDQHAVRPNLKKPYVYFALHYQPEMSTSPLAGVYVDQILIAQMLSYCLPDGVAIYIKEHPNQNLFGRKKQFYQEFLLMKNVRFVPRDFETQLLIRNAKAVVTCSGTPGWEAMFCGKPVLLFGNCFYQQAPGVFMVKTLDDCRRAAGQIFSRNWKANREQMANYLKFLSAATTEGVVHPKYRFNSCLTATQNRNNLVKAIINQIKKN